MDSKLHLIISLVLTIAFPPLGVVIYFGVINFDFWICLILTILGFIPGIIYGLYVVIAKESMTEINEDQTKASENV